MRIPNRAVFVVALLFGVSCGPLARTQAKKTATDMKALTRFSDDGRAFTNAVRDARTAIFMGDPVTARSLMAKAKAELEAAKKQVPSLNLQTVGLAAGNIPVDGQILITDDYTLTPEKQTHIGKANEHLKKGESKEANEELRLAQIDVGFTRTWIPIAASEMHLEGAIKLAADQKFYEASMALKAIQDGYTLETISLATSK